MSGGIGAPELLFFGLVALLLILLLWIIPSARLPLGGFMLVVGLVLAAVGFLGLQEIQRREASLGVVGSLAQALLPSVQQRASYATATARAELIAGIGAAGVGFVVVMWSVAPRRPQQ